MTCPDCGAETNRLAGPDGHQLVPSAGPGWRVVMVRTMNVVHACPRCEWAGTSLHTAARKVA